MTRRCSHCSNNGHNSRTCPTRASAGASATSATSSSCATPSSATSFSASGGVKLFGVRLTDGSIMKKSASMGNLSAVLAQAHHYHSSSSPNPESPLSDHVRDSSHGNDGYASDDAAHGSSSSNRRGERKKGVPWTEEEHRMFLIGLQKLGKGDWRGIARNFVVSRTPTQVASHAQKYFIRQTNATRRKRRSSLFDMVPDMGSEPQTVPEEQELPPLQSRDSGNADALQSLDLSLKPEFEPMETASSEPVKEPIEMVMMESSESSPAVSRPNEFAPIVPGTNEFTPFAPGFIPAYVSVPYPFWPPNPVPVEEGKGAESHHQVLKPVPILPKESVNLDHLVGMSQLNLGETDGQNRDPSPLSLKLIGDSSRQSAFHANAPPSGSDLSKGKSSPIQAV